jgi:hypothetical protein
LLSNDIQSVLAVAREEKQPVHANEIIKRSYDFGFLLCTDKNGAVVKIILPENNNIIASQISTLSSHRKAIDRRSEKENREFGYRT